MFLDNENYKLLLIIIIIYFKPGSKAHKNNRQIIPCIIENMA